ncbi:hypothetical protein Tco_0155550 [Tanacetum coccineum]
MDLKFVEEQRLNLLSKYNKLVFELNKCRDDLLVFKQGKVEAVTFQLQNTELIKQNYALQEQLKEEKHVDEKWLNSSNKVVNERIRLTEAPTDLESSKELGSEPPTPLPPLKNLQGASESSQVMPLTYQDHSPKKRPGLGTMKHTKPETQKSSTKSVSRPVTVCNTKPVTSSVLTGSQKQ